MVGKARETRCATGALDRRADAAEAGADRRQPAGRGFRGRRLCRARRKAAGPARSCHRMRRRETHAVLLLRLPAQHIDTRARRLARAGRHRLPLHGDLDGPQHRRPSRRWAAKACPGSARRRSRRTAHLREPRRRHLLPLGLAGDPPGIAAGVNITYKILYNDAVAMTGGQPVDGARSSVRQIAQSVRAEGVAAHRSSSPTSPEKYDGKDFPAGTYGFAPPRQLDAVQRELREIAGITVIIYDQTCATEKRRRRKRGKLADPEKRVVINELVCEGCGDCSVRMQLPVASSRSRPSSAASAGSTRTAATRTIPASRASARASSPSRATSHAPRQVLITRPRSRRYAALPAGIPTIDAATTCSSPASAAPASSRSAH